MKLAQHTGLLPSSSIQFSSLRYLCAQKSPYVLHPISHQPHYILHILSCPLSQSKRMCPLPSNTDGLKVTSSPSASPPCQWGPHRTLMPASAVMAAFALVGLLCCGWWGGGSWQRPYSCFSCVHSLGLPALPVRVSQSPHAHFRCHCLCCPHLFIMLWLVGV